MTTANPVRFWGNSSNVQIWLAMAVICTLAGCVRPAPGPAREAAPPGVANRGVPDILVTPAERRLGEGKSAAMQARWQEAEDAFRDVYGDGSAPAGMRAEALYQLGQLYANYLNPRRDPALAIAWFDQLLREFPNDILAADALARIDELKRSGVPDSPIR